MTVRTAALAVAIVLGACSVEAPSAKPNQVLGTWRMVSATIDPDGRKAPAYGAQPSGMLVFTPEMRYIEVLTAGGEPPFASNARGEGTDAENRRAMATSIAHFGTYTVDGNGVFTGNRVEGATFPNWVGNVRTRKELTLVVEGDRMTEQFQRPDGTRIAIIFERVR
ncbi:lipocalin-like domain-containing protein [Sphingomonas sp. Y38-1Y]|uniref:lipocalin-like domain-containing protein n=1 Tax=Sphingomonas sp. Y38-1Y TaxID=3078265 RepID=UPI0028E6EBD6|nr:lipocalin-like domain-containing protein [Sphingomonas sp. Y38-1Y]